MQCWTEGRSSTAVAEDLRPTAMATRASKVERCYVEPLLIRQSLRFTQVLTSETQFDFSSFGDGSEVSQTF